MKAYISKYVHWDVRLSLIGQTMCRISQYKLLFLLPADQSMLRITMSSWKIKKMCGQISCQTFVCLRVLWSPVVSALLFSTSRQMYVAVGALRHMVICLGKMLSLDARTEDSASESTERIRLTCDDWCLFTFSLLTSNKRNSVCLQRMSPNKCRTWYLHEKRLAYLLWFLWITGAKSRSESPHWWKTSAEYVLFHLATEQ